MRLALRATFVFRSQLFQVPSLIGLNLKAWYALHQQDYIALLSLRQSRKWPKIVISWKLLPPNCSNQRRKVSWATLPTTFDRVHPHWNVSWRVGTHSYAINASISWIKTGRFGCVKLIFGAGTRLRFISGGICLWCGKVDASDGSCGCGKSSYQYSFSPPR